MVLDFVRANPISALIDMEETRYKNMRFHRLAIEVDRPKENGMPGRFQKYVCIELDDKMLVALNNHLNMAE